MECIKMSLNELASILGVGTPEDAEMMDFGVDQIIFNDPATIVFWSDGEKTVVKCGEHDVYDPEKGLALCFAKRALGNKYGWYDQFQRLLRRGHAEMSVKSVVDIEVPTEVQ